MFRMAISGLLTEMAAFSKKRLATLTTLYSMCIFYIHANQYCTIFIHITKNR